MCFCRTEHPSRKRQASALRTTELDRNPDRNPVQIRPCKKKKLSTTTSTKDGKKEKEVTTSKPIVQEQEDSLFDIRAFATKEIQECEIAARKIKRKRGKIRKHNRKQAKQAKGKESRAIPIVQEEEVGAASLVDGSVSKKDKPRKQAKSAKDNALSRKISEPKRAPKRQCNTKKEDVVEGHVLGRQKAICEHGRQKSRCKD